MVLSSPAFGPSGCESSGQARRQVCHLLMNLNVVSSFDPVILFAGFYKDLCPPKEPDMNVCSSSAHEPQGQRHPDVLQPRMDTHIVAGSRAEDCRVTETQRDTRTRVGQPPLPRVGEESRTRRGIPPASRRGRPRLEGPGDCHRRGTRSVPGPHSLALTCGLHCKFRNKPES